MLLGSVGCTRLNSTTFTEDFKTDSDTISKVSMGTSLPAPDFTIELFGNANFKKGDIVSLSTFVDSPLILNFWYPSCPPCREEMHILQKTYETHKNKGLHFLGIQFVGLDSTKEGEQFIKDFGVSYAVGPDLDGSLMVSYGVIGYPTTIFLNKHHHIVHKWTGAITEEKLESLASKLLQ